jgi:hypothetical protein
MRRRAVGDGLGRAVAAAPAMLGSLLSMLVELSHWSSLQFHMAAGGRARTGMASLEGSPQGWGVLVVLRS